MDSIRRALRETNPDGDDGIARRWVKRKSGEVRTSKLLPLNEVGEDQHTTKRRDSLRRRGQCRGNVVQLPAPEAGEAA